MQNVSTSGVVTSSENIGEPRILVEGIEGKTIYVRGIHISVLVIEPDKHPVQVFGDEDEVIIALLNASEPGMYEWTFGQTGFALNPDKGFRVHNDNFNDGVGFAYAIDAYAL